MSNGNSWIDILELLGNATIKDPDQARKSFSMIKALQGQREQREAVKQQSAKDKQVFRWMLENSGKASPDQTAAMLTQASPDFMKKVTAYMKYVAQTKGKGIAPQVQEYTMQAPGGEKYLWKGNPENISDILKKYPEGTMAFPGKIVPGSIRSGSGVPADFRVYNGTPININNPSQLENLDLTYEKAMTLDHADPKNVFATQRIENEREKEQRRRSSMKPFEVYKYTPGIGVETRALSRQAPDFSAVQNQLLDNGWVTTYDKVRGQARKNGFDLLTEPVRTAMQKDIGKIDKMQIAAGRLERMLDYDDGEKYFRFFGKFMSKGVLPMLDKLGVDIENEGLDVQKARAIYQEISNIFNQKRTDITGAQAAFKELEFLKGSVINPELSPEEIRGGLKQFKRDLSDRRQKTSNYIQYGIPLGRDGGLIDVDEVSLEDFSKRVLGGGGSTPKQAEHSLPYAPPPTPGQTIGSYGEAMEASGLSEPDVRKLIRKYFNLDGSRK